MDPITLAESTHLNSIHVAENCEESKRLKTIQDVKENFGLMKQYNQLKFNKQTYTYVIPISQQFYDEINHDILNKSNNDNSTWLHKNNVAIGGYSEYSKKKPSLTINYDSDEESSSFKTTQEIQKDLQEEHNNSETEEWVSVDDKTPLLSDNSLQARQRNTFIFNET